MGEAIKAFVIGAAGAFDLSGNIFHNQAQKVIAESRIKIKEMQRISREIDEKSTRHLSARDSIALDWQNVGNDMRKAISIETLNLK